MPPIILLRSWPAGPTNGSPWTSSSPPGASPTNMIAASRLPTPSTTFLPGRTFDLQTGSSSTLCRRAAQRTLLSPSGRTTSGGAPEDGAAAGSGAGSGTPAGGRPPADRREGFEAVVGDGDPVDSAGLQAA